MTAYEHEDLKSLVAPYAIGALPEDEMPLIRDHILTCEECMAEADRYAAVSSALALAVAPVEVPKGFADRVLAEIRPAPVNETEPARQTWLQRWNLAPKLAIGALALATLGLTAGLIDARNDAESARIAAEQLAQRLEANESALAAFVHDEDAWRLEGDAGAVATMVPTSDGATFAVAGLPEAPEGHVYQLWLLRGGCGDAQPCEPTSAGLFDTGQRVVLVGVEHSLRNFAGAAVTVEPDGGSPGPTTDPVLVST